jgi:hypothetical protein
MIPPGVLVCVTENGCDTQVVDYPPHKVQIDKDLETWVY